MNQIEEPTAPLGYRTVRSEFISTEFGGHYDVTVEPDPEVRERLAALAHEQWSGWMRHMLGKCGDLTGGAITIPAAYVQAIARQMTTDYADLSEAEKQSDRIEADKVLALLRG